MSDAVVQKSWTGKVLAAGLLLLFSLFVLVEVFPPQRRTEVDLSSGRRRTTHSWLGFNVRSAINENHFSTAVSSPAPENWMLMDISARGFFGTKMTGSGRAGRAGSALWELGEVFELLEIRPEIRREIASSVLAKIHPSSDLQLDWDDTTIKVAVDEHPPFSWRYAR